jgi:xylulokinase
MGDTAQVLALDLGTSGAKAAVFAANGQVSGEPRFSRSALQLLAGGGAEQDPNEWWRALLAAASGRAGTAPASSAPAPGARGDRAVVGQRRGR